MKKTNQAPQANTFQIKKEATTKVIKVFGWHVVGWWCLVLGISGIGGAKVCCFEAILALAENYT